MNRFLLATVLVFVLSVYSNVSQAAQSGPPGPAIQKAVTRLYPGTDLVKCQVLFRKIMVGPRRVAHTAEIYGLPGGTPYWHVLALYIVLSRNNFDPNHPTCTAQPISQQYLAHKNDFGDWSITMESGSENREGQERPVACGR
jgi:hypothetical protein